VAKKPWRDVEKGDVVELGGRFLTVTKAKAKKHDRIAVTVIDKLGEFSSVVGAGDKVKVEPPAPLHTPDGRQNRWAKEAESDRADEVRRSSLPKGDTSITKRPAKPAGGPWDAPKGKAEKALEDILGAHLVGEATDENAGYYVPPVDEQTVATHSLIFHGHVLEVQDHAIEHIDITKGRVAPLVNHWHTEKRP
jgi:hypothetical protein